jgi:hypothetical protein
LKNAIRNAAQNPMLAAAILVFACAIVIGCAASGSKTRAFWVEKDGGTPTAEAVAQARADCDRHATQVTTGRSRRHLNVEWASAMRRCMDERGYVLITQPKE